jgi:DNA repair ATPase RecN
MRVKISYTVEMEEVEKEVAEIMVKATNDLDEAYHEVVSTQNLIDTGTGDLEQYLETIELARKRMMRADQVLEDCSSILKGYKLAIKQLEEQQDAIQTG